MEPTTSQDTRYPRWAEAWNDRIAEIDALILDCYNSPEYQAAQGDSDRQCRLVEERIRDWFDRRPLNTAARTEWEKVKADATYFKDRVNSRIRQLMDEGRFDMEVMSQTRQ
jgi:hypothetical protein